MPESIFDLIRNWAFKKGITVHGDLKTQTLKLGEEYGELCKALIEKNDKEIEDAIGDMVVVLTSVAYMQGTTIEACIEKAYLEIADRTGKMDNGTFVKHAGL